MRQNTQPNDFLPTDYVAPKGNSNYMKFEKGENKFRILSKPIIGWEDWENKKPLRFRMNEKPDRAIDAQKPIKHFWAFICFNYSKNEIQIMEITQKSIQSAIEQLAKDADWGSPFEYDIKVIKEGDGMDTEYTINPVPHKLVSADILDAFHNKPCNLELLFDGKDPFDKPEVITCLNDMTL